MPPNPAAKNRVCKILGDEKPFVQALMFDLTNPELVAAVSNAGGMGVLAVTSADQIDEVKALEMMASGASYDEVTEFSGTNARFWMAMSAGNVDEYAVGMDYAVNLVTKIVPAAQVVREIAGAFEA